MRPDTPDATNECQSDQGEDLERRLEDRLSELHAVSQSRKEAGRVSSRPGGRSTQTPELLLKAISNIAADHGLHVYPVVADNGVLIAQIGRFRRFSRLQEFCQAVRELSEQADISVHRVQGGWLEVQLGDVR
ncbi:MAG: hypothetical protein IT307_07975 [Chloroflexi bacterium]|nr:hypothetical protein [Chloroflexota bacterium]